MFKRKITLYGAILKDNSSYYLFTVMNFYNNFFQLIMPFLMQSDMNHEIKVLAQIYRIISVIHLRQKCKFYYQHRTIQNIFNNSLELNIT